MGGKGEQKYKRVMDAGSLNLIPRTQGQWMDIAENIPERQVDAIQRRA